MFSKRFAHGSIQKRGDAALLLKSHRKCSYHSMLRHKILKSKFNRPAKLLISLGVR